MQTRMTTQASLAAARCRPSNLKSIPLMRRLSCGTTSWQPRCQATAPPPSHMAFRSGNQCTKARWQCCARLEVCRILTRQEIPLAWYDLTSCKDYPECIHTSICAHLVAKAPTYPFDQTAPLFAGGTACSRRTTRCWRSCWAAAAATPSRSTWRARPAATSRCCPAAGQPATPPAVPASTCACSTRLDPCETLGFFE